jgi:hypothetical protein
MLLIYQGGAEGKAVSPMACFKAPSYIDTPPPLPSRSNWTRLVPPSVLIGHVSSLLCAAVAKVSVWGAGVVQCAFYKRRSWLREASSAVCRPRVGFSLDFLDLISFGI